MPLKFLCSLVLLFLSLVSNAIAKNHQNDDWSHNVPLPEGEKSIELFNGHNLDGWEGPEKYFSVVEHQIRARNEEPVKRSVFIFTKKSYQDFRLLFEVKQTMGEKYSTMHSAVAMLGERTKSQGGKFGHRGPILMFCHDWGIWDAGGRNRIYPPGREDMIPTGPLPYENIGKWNQMEILVRGTHIRMVANGQLAVDYSEADPKLIKKGPLGLQIHGNNKPQEFHFRGLVLVENPKDQLVTLKVKK